MRRIAAAGVFALALIPLNACDNFRHQLLQVQTPDIIDPSVISSPEAADALRVGALARVRDATAGGEGLWLLGGLFTDEWKSSDTFSQRNETDQRSVQDSNGNVDGMYIALQRTRNAAREAINALNTYKPNPPGNIGQMWMSMGLVEMMLAEDFCNGIPLGDATVNPPVSTEPMTTVAIFNIAIAHFDSALTLSQATDAATTAIRNATLVLKARTLVDLGQFATAAALVAAVPTSFTNSLVTFSLTTRDNQIWSLNNSAKRWTVGDSFDTSGLIKNAIPFASMADPRVKTTGSTLGTSASGKGFDTSTNLIVQGMYGRSDAAWIASGLDARLIEAEAKLQANDIAGMMTILNALRASAQPLSPIFNSPVMAALPTPATQAAATDVFFREKALWQFGRGFRMGDQRRLVRQYNRTQDNVFPTGVFFKGGNYGTDVNFPVTVTERNNPLFVGCLDRKA